MCCVLNSTVLLKPQGFTESPLFPKACSQKFDLLLSFVKSTQYSSGGLCCKAAGFIINSYNQALKNLVVGVEKSNDNFPTKEKLIWRFVFILLTL
jgi:hypothetical protein